MRKCVCVKDHRSHSPVYRPYGDLPGAQKINKYFVHKATMLLKVGSLIILATAAQKYSNRAKKYIAKENEKNWICFPDSLPIKL